MSPQPHGVDARSPQGDAGPAALRPGIGSGREALLLSALLAYAAVMWVWGAGRPDIRHSMEAARAVGAREMLRTGDYLIPRLGARPNLAKPPLFYWAVAGVSGLAGEVTEGTTRLPSALSTVASLLVLYFSVRPILGWQTAYVSSVAAATLPMVFTAATTGMVDMMLALAVTISIFAAFYMLEARRGAWLCAVACGLGLAMGVMTKWHLVLLFFLPTMTLYMGVQHEGDLLARRRWLVIYLTATALLLWLAMVVSTAIGSAGTALYLLPVGMLVYFGGRGHGGKRWFFLWATVAAVAVLFSLTWPVLAAQRITFQTLWSTIQHECFNLRTRGITQTNHEPIWYYAVALPVATLPYSLLVPLAFARQHASGASPRQKRLLLLTACWLAGTVVLFTLCSPARKLRYVLPVFPAVALLAGDVMARGVGQRLRPWMNRYVRFVGALLVYLLCLAPFALLAAWFAQRISFSGWTIAMTVVAAVSAALGVYLHRVRHIAWAPLVALTLVLIGVKTFAHFGDSERLNREHSPRAACESIRRLLPPGEDLYMAGQKNVVVLFYLDPDLRDLLEVLRERGQALVCVEGDQKESSWLPAGYRVVELGRAKWPKGELRLLRVTATTGGTQPTSLRVGFLVRQMCSRIQ